MRRVIALDQILKNRTRLPQSDVSIGIVDRWQPTVGVDGEVIRFFDIRERNGNCVVRKAEFPREWRL